MSFFSQYIPKIRAEVFFLIVAFVFGGLFLFLTPPFQVPDESNHFYRTWQVAEGELISTKQDQRVGGFLPASLERVTHPFVRMIGAQHVKLKDMEMSHLLQIPLAQGERKFYDFNNTAMYSPVCYLPGATAVLILNLFNTPPLYTFYSARLLSFLVWLCLIYYAIKIIPVYKWLFSFFALLPMSLFINISLSADAVTNAVCFLFIAVTFKYAYDPEPFSNRRRWTLFLLIFFLVSVKSVYAPLLLILWIIPGAKFKTLKNRLALVCVFFTGGFLFFVFWNSLLNPLYITYENYNSAYRDSAALVKEADMIKQMHQILHGGWYLYDVILKSFGGAFDMYFYGYIGTFGWLELSLPLWLVISCYLVIFILSVTESEKKIQISWVQKTIFLVCFSIILFLVLLSQHLIWDYVGADVILTLQGRYFIPFLPLLFMAFYNRAISGKGIAMALSIVTTLICLSISLNLIYTRYH